MIEALGVRPVNIWDFRYVDTSGVRPFRKSTEVF